MCHRVESRRRLSSLHHFTPYYYLLHMQEPKSKSFSPKGPRQFKSKKQRKKGGKEGVNADTRKGEADKKVRRWNDIKTFTEEDMRNLDFSSIPSDGKQIAKAGTGFVLCVC